MKHIGGQDRHPLIADQLLPRLIVHVFQFVYHGRWQIVVKCPNTYRSRSLVKQHHSRSLVGLANNEQGYMSVASDLQQRVPSKRLLATWGA